MSTKQYQAYEDASKAYEIADKKMKAARKEFLGLVRQTGVDLRKQFVPDDVRTTIGSIATVLATGIVIGNPDLPAVMAVAIETYPVRKGQPYEIDPTEIQHIRDYLQSQGWAIKKAVSPSPQGHVIYCI